MPKLPAHQPDPEPPERKDAVAAPAPTERMLALQRQIGNRAVGALLARAPKPKTPAKMPAPKPPQLKDGIYAVVPGIGTIELQSAQLGTSRQITSPSGQGANREASAPVVSEITVTSEQGDHSTEIFRAAIEGNLGTVEIRFVKAGKPYMTIKLYNAMISSFSISGHGGDVHDKPLESWTLNGDKIEYETAKAPAADTPG